MLGVDVRQKFGGFFGTAVSKPNTNNLPQTYQVSQIFNIEIATASSLDAKLLGYCQPARDSQAEQKTQPIIRHALVDFQIRDAPQPPSELAHVETIFATYLKR